MGSTSTVLLSVSPLFPLSPYSFLPQSIDTVCLFSPCKAFSTIRFRWEGFKKKSLYSVLVTTNVFKVSSPYCCIGGSQRTVENGWCPRYISFIKGFATGELSSDVTRVKLIGGPAGQLPGAPNTRSVKMELE